MPPKKKTETELAAVVNGPIEATVPKQEGNPVEAPRLKLLRVKNFRCIGATPVDIEIDDIVVLVGANNAGKSTILRAYELVMNDGSAKAQLALGDFHGGVVDKANPPEVELHTIVTDQPPHEKWLDRSSGEAIVRERWQWEGPDQKPKRQGFDVKQGAWVDNVPWGPGSIANARRPQPRRIEAFSQPEAQAKEVVDLLLGQLKQRIEQMPTHEDGDDGQKKATAYGLLLQTFATLQTEVVSQAQTEIDAVESHLSEFVGHLFQGHRVRFDARPEDDVSAALPFFKTGAELRMGPADGFQSAMAQQGGGARRALMWATLRYFAETPSKKNDASRPNLLLLDEPELCLHPNAVRDACRVLYDLPNGRNWQVMVTTHSPAFIDLSRDNTTVVRVSRRADGAITGTTVFRPKAMKLDEVEKEEMKLLNLYDPYVAEFFFEGHTIIVEGDTEYTAFRHAISKNPRDPLYRDLHIVRARGKVTIALLCRILNHFGASYAVLHDSDRPKVRRKDTYITNPAWTNNQKIRDRVIEASGTVRLVTLLPNFEGALFGEEAESEKPYNAIKKLRDGSTELAKVEQLLKALVDFTQPLPSGCAEWSSLGDLEAQVEAITV